jgi:hypothetical protein
MNIAIDLKNLFTQSAISTPGARTSTLTTSAFNLRGYIGQVLVTQNVGAVTGTTPTLDGKIQDSTDGSTGWADVSGYTFTQVTASDSQQSLNVDTRGVKQYIRYVGTIGGTTPSFTMGITAIGQKQTV